MNEFADRVSRAPFHEKIADRFYFSHHCGRCFGFYDYFVVTSVEARVSMLNSSRHFRLEEGK